ncbi:chemotaxis protein CheW [mine drainage metagenome]|uniref:Chemotaxis protein CheW n=1 Tax=mine drainage metagenome TaxID=410659 RepID=A0A1J5R0U9_9ZZZZ
MEHPLAEVPGAARRQADLPATGVGPAPPAAARGVINRRGSVVPVIDLAPRLGRPATELRARTCIVIVDVEAGHGSQAVGVLVDAVNAVLDLDGTQTGSPPSFGAGLRKDFIRGLARTDSGFAILLDAGHVLSNDDTAALVHAEGLEVLPDYRCFPNFDVSPIHGRPNLSPPQPSPCMGRGSAPPPPRGRDGECIPQVRAAPLSPFPHRVGEAGRAIRKFAPRRSHLPYRVGEAGRAILEFAPRRSHLPHRVGEAGRAILKFAPRCSHLPHRVGEAGRGSLVRRFASVAHSGHFNSRESSRTDPEAWIAGVRA